jgi:hypothetical protein
MKHILYKTTCKVTEKFYIGVHSTDNVEDGYLGSGVIIAKSLKKYGKENHNREILEVFNSREELLTREAEIVNEELLQNPLCMNIHLGGMGNCQAAVDFWKMPENAEKRKQRGITTMRVLWKSEKFREDTRERISKRIRNTTWMNDGEKSFRINEAEGITKGLQKGRL